MGAGEFEHLAEDVEDGEADLVGGEGGREEGVHQSHLEQIIGEGVSLFCLCK